MAQDVEIVNFGENGVASEAALRELINAVQELAKKSGGDSRTSEARIRQLYERALKSDIKVIQSDTKNRTTNTEAINEGTGAVRRFTRSMSSLVSQGIGALIGSTVNLGKELLTGGERLSDFTRHLPIVGETLTVLTSIVDDQVDVLNQLSSSGASFNNSIFDMNRAAASANMNLTEFAGFVRSNTEALALLGGTTTRGAQRFAQLSGALQESALGEQLRNMGLEVPEITDGLVAYSRLQQRLGRFEQMNQQQLIQGTADYLREVDTLSKLTGMQADEINAAMVAQQMDASFRALARTTQNLEGFNAGAVQLDAIARIAPDLATGLRELARGTTTSEAAQALMTATNGRAMEVMQRFARTGDQIQLAEDLNSIGGQLEGFAGQFSAGVLGVLGDRTTLGAVLNQAPALLRTNVENLAGVIADEQNARDGVTAEVREFRQNTREIRTALVETFLENDFPLLGNAFAAINGIISDPAFVQGLTNFTRAFIGWSSDFITGMFEDPLGTIERTFDDALSGIDYLFTNVPLLASIKQGVLGLIEALGLDHMFEDLKALFGFDELPPGTSLISSFSDIIGFSDTDPNASFLDRLNEYIFGDEDRGTQNLFERFKTAVGLTPEVIARTQGLWQDFKEFIGLPDAEPGESLYEYLKRLVMGGYESLTANGPSLYQRVVDFIGFPESLGPNDSIWARLQRFVFGDEETGQESLWDRISSGASSLLSSITTWLTDALLGERGMNEYGEMGRGEREGGILQTITQGFSDLLDRPSILESITNGFTTLLNAAEDAIQQVMGLPTEGSLWEQLLNKVGLTSTGNESILQQLGNKIYDAMFGEVVGNTRPDDTGAEIRRGGILQSISDGFASLLERQEIIDSLSRSMHGVFESVSTGFVDFWNGPQATDMKNIIVDLFEEIQLRILQILDTVPFVDTAEQQAEIIARRLERGAEASISDIQALASDQDTVNIRNLTTALREGTVSNPFVEGAPLSTNMFGGDISNYALQRLHRQVGDMDEQELIDNFGPDYANRLADFFMDLRTNSFARGTDGIKDFGSGTLAMLHGKEAVLTEDQLNDVVETARLEGANTAAPASTNSGNIEFDRLNNTLQAILLEMRQSTRLQGKIETNTASFGSNVARGRITTYRG